MVNFPRDLYKEKGSTEREKEKLIKDNLFKEFKKDLEMKSGKTGANILENS